MRRLILGPTLPDVHHRPASASVVRLFGLCAIYHPQYEILRVSKAHDDAMRTMEEKLEEFGIPHDEEYMNKSAFLGSATTGPAGLVTAGA